VVLLSMGPYMQPFVGAGFIRLNIHDYVQKYNIAKCIGMS
jgi:hypothetical protein